MVGELVSTTASVGLFPEMSGMCTVAATSGMSRQLVDRVESLSAYRHYFDDPVGPGSRNLTCFSHCRIDLGNGRQSVVSRVAPIPAGLGSRNNRIAHHLILDNADRLPSGPLSLIGAEAIFITSWSGESRWLSPRRVPRPVQMPVARPCRTWALLTGDAGWAGAALELVMQSPKRPVYIAFPEHVDPLALLDEMSSLLPSGKSWDLTFSTWFGESFDNAVDCQLRFVPDTSSGLSLAHATFDAVVLEISQLRLQPPRPSAWVESARAGARVPIRESVDRPAEAKLVEPVLASLPTPASPRNEPAREIDRQPQSGQSEAACPAEEFRRTTTEQQPPRPAALPKRLDTTMAAVITGVVGTCGVIGTCAMFYFGGPPPSGPPASTAKSTKADGRQRVQDVSPQKPASEDKPRTEEPSAVELTSRIETPFVQDSEPALKDLRKQVEELKSKLSTLQFKLLAGRSTQSTVEIETPRKVTQEQPQTLATIDQSDDDFVFDTRTPDPSSTRSKLVPGEDSRYLIPVDKEFFVGPFQIEWRDKPPPTESRLVFDPSKRNVCSIDRKGKIEGQLELDPKNKELVWTQLLNPNKQHNLRMTNGRGRSITITIDKGVPTRTSATAP